MKNDSPDAPDVGVGSNDCADTSDRTPQVDQLVVQFQVLMGARVFSVDDSAAHIRPKNVIKIPTHWIGLVWWLRVLCFNN